MAIHFLTDRAGSPASVLCGWPLYPREVNHPRLKHQLEWSRHKEKITCKRCLRLLTPDAADEPKPSRFVDIEDEDGDVIGKEAEW